MISKKPVFTIALLAAAPGSVALLLATAHLALAGSSSHGSAGVADASVANIRVERLDPAADAIVPEKPVFQKTSIQSTWTEGPVWIPAGYLLFADIPGNRILKLAPGGAISIFLHPSGYEGQAPYGGPASGSNGMTLDRRARPTVAGEGRRNVWRLESMNPKGEITVLADRYKGKRLNSPNDLVYRSDGSLYFTDPPYGLPTQGDSDPQKELKINGVYRIPDAVSQKPGAPPARAKLQLLIRDLPRPNGIAFSPDEKYLYVNNSEPKELWMRYRVHSDGTLSDGNVFFDATSDKRSGGPDGMKVDRHGNVYSAGPGGVWIFSPAGKHLATLDIPEGVGNLAWGGVNGKTLYIAAANNIYSVTLKIRGTLPEGTIAAGFLEHSPVAIGFSWRKKLHMRVLFGHSVYAPQEK